MLNRVRAGYLLSLMHAGEDERPDIARNGEGKTPTVCSAFQSPTTVEWRLYRHGAGKRSVRIVKLDSKISG